MFFRKSKTQTKLEPFSGEATILTADITRADALAPHFTPEGLVLFLKDHLDDQSAIVAKHGGTVFQFVGSYIQAIWRDSNHAEKAVEAARAMLAAADERISYSIAVATEAAVGAFFGPINQFQILGRAVDQADKLLKMPLRPKRSLLVTERTLSFLKLPESEYTKVGLFKDQGDVFSIRV
jgi:class 3 adenylate cyclase